MITVWRLCIIIYFISAATANHIISLCTVGLLDCKTSMNVPSVTFLFIWDVRLKTGSYWAGESFRPVGPRQPASSQPLWASCSEHYSLSGGSCCLYTVDSPLVWTRWSFNICPSLLLMQLLCRNNWDFDTFLPKCSRYQRSSAAILFTFYPFQTYFYWTVCFTCVSFEWKSMKQRWEKN